MKAFFNPSGGLIPTARAALLATARAALFVLAVSLGFFPSMAFDHPAQAQTQAQAAQSSAVAPLTIVTGSGRHGFTVEIADNDARRGRGLMFRRTLAPDRGMLFIYPSDRIISMWMKNTLIPLDMVFVAADGRVVSVHERAVPGSLKPISSGARVRAVVELAGGSVSRLGIRPGDRVINGRLGTR